MLIIKLLILLLPALTWADCNIETYSESIKINKVQDKSLIKKTNCSHAIVDRFLELASSLNGTVQSRYLEHYLQEDHEVKVVVSPKAFKLTPINEFLKKKLDLPSNFIITDVTSLYPKSSLPILSGSNFSTTCNQCSKLGKRNVKLNTGKQSHWLTITLKQSQKVLTLNKDFPFTHKKITSADVVEKIIITSTPELFISDINSLNFMALSRPLRKGDFLKTHSLLPRTLIKRGQPVTILYKKGSITLRTLGTSQGQGRWGDRIKVLNSKSKKPIWAVINNDNTVVVQ